MRSSGEPSSSRNLVGARRITINDDFIRRRAVVGAIVRWGLFAMSLLSLLITVSIVLVLLTGSLGFFAHVSLLDFFTDTVWTPSFADHPRYGILPLMSGTLMSALIAMSFAAPLGLILAFYLSEYASKTVRETVKPIMEFLAGIPTVALGYFALVVVTPFLKSTLFPSINTYNLLSPGLVIGVMILPYVVSLSEDAMRAVPNDLREGAYGMGFNRFQTCFRVILPAAFSGVVASLILAMSRAIGETMIVAIAAGQNAVMAFNPLKGGATVTTYIVQVSHGDLPHGTLVYSSIFAAGLVLFFTTFAFNYSADWIRRRYMEAY